MGIHCECPPCFEPTDEDNMTIENRRMWEAKAFLDDSIRADAPPALLPLQSAEHIFLSGASGFLGAYLLDEMLRNTTATVHCLVRAEDVASGYGRLVQRLVDFDLWDAGYSERIVPVLGDLAQPLLGLSAGAFDALARLVQVIYHSGGWVTFIHPYEKLEATNVQGTHEVIRLATTARLKAIHYISSLAIFLSEAHPHSETLYEATVPQYHETLKGGYKLSKWVADRMMIHAQERGVPVAIYRPSRIAGHSHTGLTGDLKDPLNVFIKGCLLLGKYPDSDVGIEPVPIDYVSCAVFHLAQQPQSVGKAFNLYNPHPLSWKAIFTMLHKMGYTLEPVRKEDWLSEVNCAMLNKHPQREFLTLVRMLVSSPNNNFFYKRPPLDASHVRIGLQQSGIRCPSVVDLMPVYMAYYQQSGFIERP